MTTLIFLFRTGVIIWAALLFVAGANADAPGVLIRGGELKAQPFLDAGTIATLADNTALTVIANQGAWSQIKTVDGKTGWVRLLNIRLNQPEEVKTSGQSLAQLGGVLRTGTTKPVATTGAKGLTREQIAKAQPNPAEVRKMDSLKARPDDVEKFGAARKLVVQKIAELNP